MKWYTRASQKGNLQAQNNLGLMYKQGKGVARDFEVAFNLFLSAAEEGYMYAQCNLGGMYYFGEGVAHSCENAFK